MVNAGYVKKDISGMSPKEQLAVLMKETHDFMALQYSTYSRMLLPQLRQNGLCFVEHHEQLTQEQAQFVDRYFEENVYPVPVSYTHLDVYKRQRLCGTACPDSTGNL